MENKKSKHCTGKIKKRRRYQVFWSYNYLYCEIIAALLPWLALYFAVWMKAAFLYVFFFILLVACGYALALLLAALSFDENGIYCHRPFRKTIFVEWKKICYHGTFQRRFAQGEKTADFYYFCTDLSRYKELTSSKNMPQLCDSFLFIMIRPSIKETINQYTRII